MITWLNWIWLQLNLENDIVNRNVMHWLQMTLNKYKFLERKWKGKENTFRDKNGKKNFIILKEQQKRNVSL